MLRNPDVPPKKNVRKVDEYPENAVSGIMSIEKEGDEPSGGSRENLSEEAAAQRLEELEKIFNELHSKIGSESPEDRAALMRVGGRISDQITRTSPSKTGLLTNVEASIREAINDAPALTKYLAPEISMEEVLDAYQKTAAETASGADAAPTKALKPSKFNMKERTRGEKKADAMKASRSAAYEGEPHYGVPAVTDDVTETRKERQEALRDAVLKKQAELTTAASKKVIPLPDQTEERLREIKVRLGANRTPDAGASDGTLRIVNTLSDDSAKKSSPSPEAQPTIPVPKKAGGMDEYLERTRGEKTRKLSEILKEKDEEFVLPADKKFHASALYEKRVTNFAERTGLTAERNALAAAEAAYYRIRKNSYAKSGKETGNLKTLKQAYTDSLFAWNRALESKANLDPESRVEALVIRKRDTILRPQSLEVQARKAGMSQKEWTDIGRYLNKDTFENVAKVASVPAGFLGKGIAMLHKSAQGDSESAKLQREILGKKYGRAAMIVGGAGVATLVAISATPVTAAAGALTFGVFVGRGVIGTVAGTLGGYASGGIYQKFFGNKKRQQLGIAKGMEKGFATKEEYEAFLKEYGKSNVHKRGKEKARWQIAGSLVAGGSTGLVTSPIAHLALDQMGALPSVQNAAETIASTDSDSSAVETPRIPEAAPEATAAVVAPSAPEGPFLQEAVIGRGEGFNQLFVDIRNSDFAGTTAVGKMLLNGELSATELSDRIGAFDPKTGESAVMQVGDKVVLDSNENLWFVRADGEAYLLMENPTPPSGEVIVHELPKNIDMAPTIERSESIASPAANVAETAPSASLQEEAATVPVVSNETTPEPTRTSEVTSEVPQQSVTQPTLTETPASDVPSRVPGIESIDDYNARIAAEGALAAGSSEGVTNAYGVQVNPTEASVYEWKDPQTGIAHTSIFGGSAEEISRALQAEMSLDPTARVLVNTPVVDSQTGELTIRVDEWRIGDEGEPQRVEGVRDVNGRSLPPITAENLIRKLR